MRACLLSFPALLAASLSLGAQNTPQPVTSLEFPTFTVDQNWNRASLLGTSTLVAGLAYAKGHGQSAEEFGRWTGDLFAPGWGDPNSGSAIRVARAIQNNLRSSRGMTVEVMSVNDTAITLRATRPHAAYFSGPGRSALGVTLEEYEQSVKLFYEQIGKRVGLRIDYRVLDSNLVTMSLIGRGKDAVLDFPKATTYTITFSAQDATGNPAMAGAWESSYAADGRFAVRHEGAVAIEGNYELALDQIVFRNERGATACAGPGKYRWTVNPANGNLTFGRLSDDCDARFRYLTRRAFTKKGAA